MDSDVLEFWALRSHIVTGTVVLIMGIVALVSRKGGHWHRHCGTVYVYFMSLVCLSAVVVAIEEDEPFLLYLAIFVFHLAFSGRRSVARKRPDQWPRATWPDWLVVSMSTAATVGLVVQARTAMRPDIRMISGYFAALNGFIVAADVYEFLYVPPLPRPWWFMHMMKMVGSFIGAITAVVVVQVSGLPFLVRYIGPPLILVPLLVVWMAYYFVRFRRASAPRLGAAPMRAPAASAPRA